MEPSTKNEWMREALRLRNRVAELEDFDAYVATLQAALSQALDAAKRLERVVKVLEEINWTTVLTIEQMEQRNADIIIRALKAARGDEPGDGKGE